MAEEITIRRARKEHRCANRHAALVGNAPGCTLTIKPGEQYVEGDVDPYLAGGFGHDRICLPCHERDGR